MLADREARAFESPAIRLRFRRNRMVIYLSGFYLALLLDTRESRSLFVPNASIVVRKCKKPVPRVQRFPSFSAEFLPEQEKNPRVFEGNKEWLVASEIAQV